MRTTFNLELKPDKKENGLHPIFLRITQNRKHRRIATGIEVEKSHFNFKANFGKWIRTKNPLYAKLNAELEDLINGAKQKYSKLKKELKNTEPALTKTANALKDKPAYSFIEFAEKKIEYFRSKGHLGMAKNYDSVICKLKGYRKDLLFDELTIDFLQDYTVYLKKKAKLANSTIHNHQKTIRAILYQAIPEHFAQENNPFFKFKLESPGESKTVKLDREEIKKITEKQIPEGSNLWHVRNYFMFSYYCAGIRVGDLIQLKWRNIQDNRLEYEMMKTGKLRTIRLFDESNKILFEYYAADKGKDVYIFPILMKEYSSSEKLYAAIQSKTAQINNLLKDLAKLCDIDKKLSFHVSRHSFANRAKQNNVPISEISELLGHEDLKTTKTYLNRFPDAQLDSAHKKALL